MLYFNNLHVYLHLWKAGLLWPACWTPCASLATHVSWKLTGKSVQDWYLFPYNIDIFECLFFCNIQLNLSDFPYLLTERKLKKKKKKKNRLAVLFSQSSKRAITDQIFSELEEMLSILLGFRKHMRYVARMRAWTVENEAQPRHWEIEKIRFWKTSEQKWLTLCLICLFYVLFIQCWERMGWGRGKTLIWRGCASEN